MMQLSAADCVISRMQMHSSDLLLVERGGLGVDPNWISLKLSPPHKVAFSIISQSDVRSKHASFNLNFQSCSFPSTHFLNLLFVEPKPSTRWLFNIFHGSACKIIIALLSLFRLVSKRTVFVLGQLRLWSYWSRTKLLSLFEFTCETMNFFRKDSLNMAEVLKDPEFVKFLKKYEMNRRPSAIQAILESIDSNFPTYNFFHLWLFETNFYFRFLFSHPIMSGVRL